MASPKKATAHLRVEQVHEYRLQLRTPRIAMPDVHGEADHSSRNPPMRRSTTLNRRRPKNLVPLVGRHWRNRVPNQRSQQRQLPWRSTISKLQQLQANRDGGKSICVASLCSGIEDMS